MPDPAYVGGNREKASFTPASMGRGCPNPTSSDASRHWPSRRHGRMSGSVLLRTATFRRPAGTPRDASNTATTRAFAKFGKARNTSTSSGSPTLFRPFGKRWTSIWRLRGLPREKVLATVVHLLETTLIRVGNDDYAKRTTATA